MTPGATVFVLNGRRIEAVVLANLGVNWVHYQRREAGYPDLREHHTHAREIFATPEAARSELRRRREERIAALARLLERERAFDPDAAPVHDMTKPRKRGAR